MSYHTIDIAKYLSMLESKGLSNPFEALHSCSKDLATDLKKSLESKEHLEAVNGQTPLLESYSAECYMWALSILTSSWTKWIFTSKSNNPEYQQHHDERQAGANARVVSSYIRNSIIDAISKGREIGQDSNKAYRPEGAKAQIELRK